MKTSKFLINGLVITALLLSNLAWAPAVTRAKAPEAPDAQVLYVKEGASGGCTTSWGNACNLQAALGMSTTGDDIWVAAGTYKPGTNRTDAFQLVSGVALYGGFPDTGDPGWVDRNWVTYASVLSGDIDNNDISDSNGVVTDTMNINGDNSYHVVINPSSNLDVILDGFTITAGSAFGASSTGGGGLANSGNLTVNNVTFSGNEASIGGGLANNWGEITLTQVVFRGNSAEAGGGMFAGGYDNILDQVTFDSNTADGSGGGLWTYEGGQPVLTNVIFSNNQAGGNGGGMSTAENGAASLENVTFDSNQSGGSGGGLYSFTEFYPTSMVNVTFSNNQAAESGGGFFSWPWVSDTTLDNVAFINNQADVDNNGSGDGGGAYVYQSVPGQNTLAITDTVFISNTAASGGGFYDEGSKLILSQVKLFGNQADGDGGGLFNGADSLTMVNSALSGNHAGGDGGGIYNLINSPVITNTTFSANTATQGGGIFFLPNFPPASLTLPNSILWGNRASADNSHQIYPSTAPAQDAHCMVENYDGEGYHVCNVIEDMAVISPFFDADGVDDLPGTEDDDLRLTGRSHAIDSGDNELVPAGITTDIDGNLRFFADQDLNEEPDAGAPVDLGAYEAQGFAWYLNKAYSKLELGQLYREGFHADLDSSADVTLADTLSEYVAQAAEDDFNEALDLFDLAQGYAATWRENQQVLVGVQDTFWELASAAMLFGNEQMVSALDVTAGGQADSSMTELQEALNSYNKATNWYLELFTGQESLDFLASQPDRIDPLTGDPLPYADLKRMAYASAKKSRATLELAERQFRKGDSRAAQETAQEGFYTAMNEMAVLHDLWPDVVEEDSYLELLRNMSDMQRIFGWVQQDKNPLGYGPEFVPFHYRPTVVAERGINNYEQTKWIADDFLDNAEESISPAAGYQQLIDDNYVEMQTALFNAADQYESELQALCGNLEEADCESGTIYEQLNAIKGAMLRVDLVLQQMENQNQLIRIEQERAAEVAGIHRATAELIMEDGEKLADLASQEVELKESKGAGGGILGMLSGAFSGASSGASIGGPYGAIAGGLVGLATSAFEWGMQEDTASSLQDIAAEKERLYAKQQARVQYAEAAVTLADSEALQRQYFLKFAELQIDYSIALNNLMQELARLKSLQTRAQYLLEEKQKAETYYSLLYREYLDPAARVLRNEMMETAHSQYEVALDQAYRAGRALAYEINQEVTYSGNPMYTLDDLYPINDSFFLGSALNQMNQAYESWHADNPSPQPRTDIVYLSRAMGFEDFFDPQLGRLVTREEQFNALVRGRDETQKLSLQFMTSIHLGNIFFPTLFYNDKIISIRARVLGENLGVAGREPVFVDIRLSQTGTSFIRSGASQIACGGEDDLQEYNIKPQVATIQSAIYQNSFPQVNKELATRSVAFTNWVLEIDTAQGGENQYLNLDQVDEIELHIEHEAYTLQCTGSSQATLKSSLSFEPKPTRPYQPMQQVLPDWDFNFSSQPATESDLNIPTNGVDLNDTYIGSVYLQSPPFMPPLSLVVALEGSDSEISGYISPTLSYPMAPLSGNWSGHSFSMQSDPFIISLDSGTSYTRQIFFETGVISDSLEINDSGITLSGNYREVLTGLAQDELVFTGTFRLDRPEHILEAAFTADSVTGTPGAAIQFEDLSIGAPTSWQWNFGDGTTSTEQHPIHAFARAGSYTVSLSVLNEFGSSTQTEEHYILIYNPKLYLPIVSKN